MNRIVAAIVALGLAVYSSIAWARYIQADLIGVVPNPTPRAITASDVLRLHQLNHSYAYVSNNPLTSVDPMGLVDWKGVFGGFGVAQGVGGAVFGYRLTSECKCGQRVTISGSASSFTAGLSVKAATASGSGAEFYDYNSCPDPSVASGLFAMSSASFVIGTGPGYSKIQLGGLRSYSNVGDQNYGLDVSIGVYLGASAVTDAKVECCN